MTGQSPRSLFFHGKRQNLERQPVGGVSLGEEDLGMLAGDSLALFPVLKWFPALFAVVTPVAFSLFGHSGPFPGRVCGLLLLGLVDDLVLVLVEGLEQA